MLSYRVELPLEFPRVCVLSPNIIHTSEYGVVWSVNQQPINVQARVSANIRHTSVDG